MRSVLVACLACLASAACEPRASSEGGDASAMPVALHGGRAPHVPDMAIQHYIDGDLDSAIAVASDPRKRARVMRIRHLYQVGLRLSSDPKSLKQAAGMLEQARDLDHEIAPGSMRQKIDKAFARCLLILGTNAFVRDDPGARRYLDRALECDPQNEEIRALLEKIAARAEQLLGEARELEKVDPVQAEKKRAAAQKMARAEEPGKPLFTRTGTSRRLRRAQHTGTEKRDAGRPDGTEDKTAKELRREGILAHKKGEFLEAIGKYERAYELEPRDADLLRLLGAAYAQKGERAKAYEYYKRYASACPKCSFAPAIRKIIKDYEDGKR
ncbi:MAG: tetratricopeptide repeat protein [Deltaproteobacteria bacterium]|nr:tetratricopeptide repeat protein [Deltaproteobacteria bacterium]